MSHNMVHENKHKTWRAQEPNVVRQCLDTLVVWRVPRAVALDLLRYVSQEERVRARSHCAIRNCDLLMLTMGCIEASEVVTVA